MQIQLTEAQDGDVVLDGAGKVWRLTTGQWENTSAETSADGSGLTAPLALLVRAGVQVCCTPDGHTH